MKKYVFFNNGSTDKECEVTNFFTNYTHISQFLTKVRFDGIEHQVLEWGNMMYIIEYINDPIKMYKRGEICKIQYVLLKPFGFRYVIETSDDNGKTWDCISESCSFLDFEKCYNEMKKVAMSDLAEDIDVQQDFSDDANHVYNYDVKISLKEIVVKSTNFGKMMKYYIIK